MLSDTHCHLSYMDERGESLAGLIASMRERAFSFVLDIGTKPGDFSSRVKSAREASGLAGLPPFLHFSCGLWPDAETIADRAASFAALETDIAAMLDLARERADSNGPGSYAALGECGLDRYWNGRRLPNESRLPMRERPRATTVRERLTQPARKNFSACSSTSRKNIPCR